MVSYHHIHSHHSLLSVQACLKQLGPRHRSDLKMSKKIWLFSLLYWPFLALLDENYTWSSGTIFMSHSRMGRCATAVVWSSVSGVIQRCLRPIHWRTASRCCCTIHGCILSAIAWCACVGRQHSFGRTSNNSNTCSEKEHFDSFQPVVI